MNLSDHKTLQNLKNNSRFYILSSSTLLSLGVMSYLRLHLVSDQLFYIRLEQIFGVISIIFLYVALITSPLSKMFGKERLAHLLFARRAIGVSAAYFALLHFGVALWGQLGGPSRLELLPPIFKWSLGMGIITLVILLMMAATSIDKVIAFMTLRRWKWLHRLVYLCVLLLILHIWTIGTHVARPNVQIIGFITISAFFGLESFRIAYDFAQRYPEFKSKDYFITITLSLWLILETALLALPGMVSNFHAQRHGDHNTSSTQHQQQEAH
jgi:sulfoxide reductase heme-binding subunit YedZ